MPSRNFSKADLAKLAALHPELFKQPGNSGKGAKRKSKSKEMVEESFVVAGPNGGPMWTLPVKTVSEANQRGWHGKANRTTQARNVICKALGKNLRHVVPFSEAYHKGEMICVIITRLGGGKLDRMSNLGAALKSCEDSLALIMGANDGDDRWDCKAQQSPGGPMGVTIELLKTGSKVQ